jgi:Glycosyl hydrolase family 12/Cellulose binding domain
MRRPRSVNAAILAAAVITTVTAVTAVTPAQAAPVICEQFGGAYIQNNTLRVQNNVWGASTAQCIDVNQSGGFTVTQAAHNKPTNGAPAAYPSIYAGCHYAQCTSGSGLPMQASAPGFGNVSTSVSVTYPSSGTWNAAYDLWFDPTPRTDGQNTGAEIMVWLNYQGSIQPVGSQVATVNLLGATWQVWFGNIGWNVISYRRTSPTTSLSFAVDTFLTDAINRGYAQRSWYLTSVQAGFEPWVGGAGLAVNSFTYTPSGNPGDPGGGTGTCTVRFDQWSTGYVAHVTVNGPRSGWSFPFALPSGHGFQNGWNAGFTRTGQNVTAANLSYNGNLSSGQSTQWGFQASRPNGNLQLPTIPGCTVV